MRIKMMTYYFLRHAESVANVAHSLAGQLDFPLSSAGKDDAQAQAEAFHILHPIQALWCSPLLRAQQTAAPFLVRCDVPLRLDVRLMEQHMGRFSGMNYAEAEADPGYCQDRTARWDWIPEGGGESYRQMADRVGSFLVDLENTAIQAGWKAVLIVTHAVTLRLIRAVLEGTLPRYPETIAGNGELWVVQREVPGGPVTITSENLAGRLRPHRA